VAALLNVTAGGTSARNDSRALLLYLSSDFKTKASAFLNFFFNILNFMFLNFEEENWPYVFTA
jgi:hypothetical protein